MMPWSSSASGILLALFGAVLSCPAQKPEGPQRTVSKAAGSRSENAAVLYSLAIAEFKRVLPGGFQVTSHYPELLALALAGDPDDVNVDGMRLVGGQEVARAREVLAQTVLARSLFAQAATRVRCEFEVVPLAQKQDRDLALWQLRQLVEFDSQVEVNKHPQVACEGARAILNFCHHRSKLAGLDQLQELLQAEERALGLLGRGLEALRKGRRWQESRGRYAALLDQHEARRFRNYDVSDEIVKRIAKVVELHRPRLRDVHMHVAGGFDQDAMCRRLTAVVLRCIEKEQQGSGVRDGWQWNLDRRLQEELPKPAKDASVTEKATYGMAQLVLPNGNVLGQSNAAVVAAIAKCRAIIKKKASGRRRKAKVR